MWDNQCVQHVETDDFLPAHRRMERTTLWRMHPDATQRHHGSCRKPRLGSKPDLRSRTRLEKSLNEVKSHPTARFTGWRLNQFDTRPERKLSRAEQVLLHVWGC